MPELARPDGARIHYLDAGSGEEAMASESIEAVVTGDDITTGFNPAYLLESVEGGERLGRFSFLGVGPRRLLEVRDGRARIQTRPVTVPTYTPDLPVETDEAPDPLDASPRRAARGRAAA